jgi:hypothetical protein
MEWPGKIGSGRQTERISLSVCRFFVVSFSCNLPTREVIEKVERFGSEKSFITWAGMGESRLRESTGRGLCLSDFGFLMIRRRYLREEPDRKIFNNL